MKKVLFATTALVASAGIAHADGHLGVAVTGGAEIGVVGGSRYGDETQFFSSVDVRFSMTGETSGGLSFGATIDLDDAVDHAILGFDHVDNTGGQFTDYTVFLSGNFGTVTMGDTDGAFDWALQEADIGAGSIDDSHTTHAGFSGNSGYDGIYDGQVVRYDNSFGGFEFAISAEMDDAGVFDPAFGIGARYATDLGGIQLGIGLGFQTGDVFDDIFGVSLDARFGGGFRVVLNYSDLDVVNGDDHFGIGASYEFDAIVVSANYGEFGNGDSGFGLSASYDLGGGAVIQFGYGDSDFDDPLLPDEDTFSLGVSMSF
ncbi:MAG: porin [Pseudomonadota bacterium]